MGKVRHGPDIRADDTVPQSQGILNFQTGQSFDCCLQNDSNKITPCLTGNK